MRQICRWVLIKDEKMIALRYMKRNDIQTVLSWQKISNADDLYQWAGDGYSFPLSEVQIANRLKRQDVNHVAGKHHIYVIEWVPTRKVIGQIELDINDVDKGIASVGKFIIGNPLQRGQGYGVEALSLLVKNAFDVMGLNQLFLKVFDFNTPAIRCYEQVGFTIVKKEYQVYNSNSGYWDRVYMFIENHNQ